MSKLSGDDLAQIKEVLVDPIVAAVKTEMQTFIFDTTRQVHEGLGKVDGMNGRVSKLESNQSKAIKGLVVWAGLLSFGLPALIGYVRKKLFG